MTEEILFVGGQENGKRHVVHDNQKRYTVLKTKSIKDCLKFMDAIKTVGTFEEIIYCEFFYKLWDGYKYNKRRGMALSGMTETEIDTALGKVSYGDGVEYE